MRSGQHIARLLVWPVVISGFGLVFMFAPASHGHPLFGGGRPVSGEMTPLAGLAMLAFGGIQIVVVLVRWWRSPKQ